jgi:hypothetical protein
MKPLEVSIIKNVNLYDLSLRVSDFSLHYTVIYHPIKTMIQEEKIK